MPHSIADTALESLASQVDGPVRDLLRYYQDKLQRVDEERKSLLNRVADIEVQQADAHNLRLHVKSSASETAELQKALQDAKLYLYDEREQLLKLQAENDNLKQQEVADRQRIQQLLALTAPLTEEYTYFRDVRPVATASSNVGASAQDGFAIRPSASAPATVPVAVPGVGQLHRLPVDGPGQAPGAMYGLRSMAGQAQGPSNAHYEEQISSLKRQLADFRRLSDERTAAYARDRASLLDNAARRTDGDAGTIRSLETQLETAQAKLTALTRDFLLQRHAFTIAEREAKEETAAALTARDEAQEELVRISRATEAEVTSLRAQLEAQGRHMKQLLSARLQSASDDVKIVAAKVETDRKAAQASIAKLQEALRREKDKYASLSRRRALEIEGYSRDVAQLRKQLRTLEAQWAMVVQGNWPGLSLPADLDLGEHADLAAGLEAAQAALDAALHGVEAMHAGMGGTQGSSSGKGSVAGTRTGTPAGASPPSSAARSQGTPRSAGSGARPGSSVKVATGSRVASGAQPAGGSPAGPVNVSPRLYASSSSVSRTAGRAGQGLNVSPRAGSAVRPASAAAARPLGRNTLAGYTPVAYAAGELAEALGEAGPEGSPYGHDEYGRPLGPDGQPLEPFPGDLDYQGPEDGDEDGDEQQGEDGQEGQEEGQLQDEGQQDYLYSSGLQASRGQQDRSSPAGSTGSSSGSSGSRKLGAPRRVPITSPEAAPRYDSGPSTAEPGPYATGAAGVYGAGPAGSGYTGSGEETDGSGVGPVTGRAAPGAVNTTCGTSRSTSRETAIREQLDNINKNLRVLETRASMLRTAASIAEQSY